MNKGEIENLIKFIQSVKNNKAGDTPFNPDALKIALADLIVSHSDYLIRMLEIEIQVNAEIGKFFGDKDE